VDEPLLPPQAETTKARVRTVVSRLMFFSAVMRRAGLTGAVPAMKLSGKATQAYVDSPAKSRKAGRGWTTFDDHELGKFLSYYDVSRIEAPRVVS